MFLSQILAFLGKITAEIRFKKCTELLSGQITAEIRQARGGNDLLESGP